MTNSERIQANNEALEEAIALANGLPDAGGVIEPLNVTKNGTYTTPNGVDGYSPVTVNVPIPDGYIKPNGTLNLTQNGSHDVTQYAGVNVNVPVGVTVQTKSGTFTTDGSGKATVNCGWKPDFLAFNIGMANRYPSFSGMPFAAANATDLEMIMYPANTQTHAFVIVFGNVTSSGFSIEAHKVAYSMQATADSNRSFNYTAIKYT